MTPGPVDVGRVADRLAAFPAVLRAACTGLSAEDLRFRADGTSWSVLEVVCHLADEEVLDFPVRLERTLADPAAAWDPIDPEGWATSKGYRERDLEPELVRFAELRRTRVAWLRTLVRPDWTAAHQHPAFGAIQAGELLTGWSAHDALHLRQIARRLHELAVRDGAGFSPRYAGDW